MDAFFDVSSDTSGMHQDQLNQLNDCDRKIVACTCNSSDNRNQNQLATAAAAAAVNMKQQSPKVENCVSYCKCSHINESAPLEVSKDKFAMPTIQECREDRDTDAMEQSPMDDSKLDVLNRQLSNASYNASEIIPANSLDLNRQYDADGPTTEGPNAQNTKSPHVIILIPNLDANDASKSIAGQSQPTTQPQRKKNANSNKAKKLRSGRYKCDHFDCDYSTDIKSSLKSHSRVHSDDRPYECKICQKNFRYKSSLNRHMKTHGKQFAYQCSKCGQGFARENLWKLHVNGCTAKSAVDQPNETLSMNLNKIEFCN